VPTLVAGVVTWVSADKAMIEIERTTAGVFNPSRDGV